MSWPLVKLAEVATINPRLPKDVDEAQEVSFVAMASASEEGSLLAEESRVLSETRKGFTYFEKSDVLLAKITTCFENGKCLRPNQIRSQIGFGSTELGFGSIGSPATSPIPVAFGLHPSINASIPSTGIIIICFLFITTSFL